MERKTNRREFLGAAGSIAAGIALVHGLAPRLAQAQDTADDFWVATLGSVKKLNEKEPTLVKAQFFESASGKLMDEEKVYVRWEGSHEGGRWIVISAICTHLKCKVDFVEDEGIFRCPCHKSEYDIDGAVIRKPSKKDLPDYSSLAYEEDGQLKLKRAPI